jgi:hypothetical protein
VHVKARCLRVDLALRSREFIGRRSARWRDGSAGSFRTVRPW